MSLHPVIKWSQRKDKVFITLGLRDIAQEKVDLKAGHIEFKGSSNGKHYQFKVNFFSEIDNEKSQFSKTGFHMVFVIKKRADNQQYWPRLTKQAVKSQYIQIDWDKWIDEDEQEEQGKKGLEDLDQYNMNNFADDSDDQMEEEAPKDNEGKLDDLDQDEEIQKPQTKTTSQTNAISV